MQNRRVKTVGSIAILLTLALLSGCSGGDTAKPPAQSVEDAARLTALSGTLPGFASWQEVLDAARGGSVRWYLWGGSASINDFVDTQYGEVLARDYGISLVRVPVADTREAVAIVMAETEAGKKSGGAVDLIWINGLNFYTLRQADLLYGPWAESLPNAALVDWENPSLRYDFGVPVDGYESPWSSAQFQFIYDSARMDEAKLPRSYRELDAWVRANPGRFTYVAPSGGAFQGTRFVKQALYELSGGYEQFLGPWNQALFDEKAPALWAFLNAWEPYLWRQGKTYPASENELHQLFANGEVDFSITLATAGAGPSIAAGLIPQSSRAYAFNAFMIGDYNYLAIPANASNKAAALVLANLILEPDRQALQILPEYGFGLGYAVDMRKLDDADRALLEASLAKLGPAAADAESLRSSFAPDLAPESQEAIEKGWEAKVLRE
jgi:putative spermidine/putrescine transport system substrate-binding protein